MAPCRAAGQCSLVAQAQTLFHIWHDVHRKAEDHLHRIFMLNVWSLHLNRSQPGLAPPSCELGFLTVSLSLSHSMESCWTLDPPTRLCISTSGRQRKITTLAEWSRSFPAKSMVKNLLHTMCYTDTHTHCRCTAAKAHWCKYPGELKFT